ncbi:hypothetical protein MP638_006023 [Amoeboaphelidium occidentale]|nr:hypothetical protein MP638_006023 [Amoeboaphelidium occidentale]
MQGVVQAWAHKETATSFECAEYLQRQIHVNYGGSSTVHIGFLYIAVGKNFGVSTDRYILVIPFYNPAEHGYNYKVQNPSYYFMYLQESWNESANLLDGNGKAAILTCSPVRLYKFVGNDLKAMDYTQSDHESLAVYDGFLEFWIHGPRNTAAIKLLPDTFNPQEFQNLVQKVLDKETDAV